MYQLGAFNQANLLSSSDRRTVTSIYPIRFNGHVNVCVRQGEKLIGYNYGGSGAGGWQQKWNETVFSLRNNYPVDKYPWLVTDSLLPNKNVIVLRHPDGIRFYQVDQTGLNLVTEDGNFHEVYKFDTFLLGKFYPDSDYVGVLTRNSRGGIEFFAATSDSFDPDQPDPLFPLTTELSFNGDWKVASTDIFLTKLIRNSSELIGLRNEKGLEFYRFNSDYQLERFLKTSKLGKFKNRDSKNDVLFFADLSNRLYQDILFLNASGLHVYQYDNKQDYEFIHRNTDFTEARGWLPKYGNSIRIFDLNNDGRDDLIFTGPQGLTAMTFDFGAKIWKNLLNTDQLSAQQRYANIVGTLPAMSSALSQPSIFIQDAEGKLQWAKVEKALTPSTTEKPTTEAPSLTTTAKPISISLVKQSSHAEIPKQVARSYLAEKPILHWTEQWDSSFLKEVVNVASGQVNLNIPLVDTAAVSSWNLHLTLSYKSQMSSSDLLGVGWSLPIGQDLIYVDYNGSVFPENAQYYLIIGGQVQRLKTKSCDGKGIECFQLAEADKGIQLTIEYHPADQRWVVEDQIEQATYGKADSSVARDALMWMLGWPNWRGPGRDRNRLKPLIGAWYLNKRLNKDRQQALYYYYEIDSDDINGKSYSSAIRLKTITDNQEMKFTLDYAEKNKDEYTVTSPVDEKGNIHFPVQSTQAYYLQRYHLTTPAYTQSLKFLYRTNDGKRYLTAIKQQLLSESETLLKFEYQNSSERKVIKSCEMPARELKVEFNYKSITRPAPTSVYDNVMRYPFRKNTKITYGSNYAIMAYPRYGLETNKVILRIMDRDMMRTVTDCALYSMISCPSLSSEIQDFTIHAHQNYFGVILDSNQGRVLYLYNHQNDTWSTDKKIHSFGKKALVQFSETMIAVAEPDVKMIKLFEFSDLDSTWNATDITISRPITNLALQNRLVITYDDRQLQLFHHTPESGWQNKILQLNLVGLKTTNRQFIEKFDLTDEIKEQLSPTLKQNTLQIFDNSILLSALEERSGQLSLKLHLFLLDSEYNVAKKQPFEITRENIWNIERQNGNEDKIVQHLGYVEEGDLFKVRVKSVSGKNFDENYPNKNLREDEMEENKKNTNESPEFQQSAKELFLLDWNLYNVQIAQNGVYCGNDTLLRFTGTKWEKESVADSGTKLGKHFVLKSDNTDKSLLKLYRQNSNRNEQELKLHSPGQLINRYPSYIAYHPEPNLVKVLTFKDEKTLGQLHTFNDEQLLHESDWQNLVTIRNVTNAAHSEIQEVLVRPAHTFNPSEQLFVNQIEQSDKEVQRLTGYQRSFDINKEESMYSETVTMIPGDARDQFGWYEATRNYQVNSGNFTKTERWFDANGDDVLGPPEEGSDGKASNTTSAASGNNNPMLLLDRSERWLISDFSPFSLADEMVAYYGFESYEKNQIGVIGTKAWNINQAKIVRGRFAFTGESYLELSGFNVDSPAFIEGVFEPKNQDITYLAACWIRSGKPLTLNTPVSYLKAIISTSEVKNIIGLKAVTKRQSGDWFYLELPINFKEVVKQIYQDYVDYAVANNQITANTFSRNTKIRITLRVEAPQGETIDLDHIRFAPIVHDFQATVYNSLRGKITDKIQNNGLVTRNIYNRLQKEVANIDEDGQLTYFSSSSRTGKLVPLPQIKRSVNVKPSTVTFEPENGSYETFNEYSLLSRWSLVNPTAWNTAPGQLWHTQSGEDSITAREHLFNRTSASIRFYFALHEKDSSLTLNWQGNGSLKLHRKIDNSTSLVLLNNYSITRLPSAGELIIMLEQNYIWLWLDGVLLVDQELPSVNTSTPWSSFALKAQGKVLVEDLIIMNRPQVKVEYFNAFSEKTQMVQLEDSETIQVSEIFYDELGREAITTKTTRIKRNADQPLLAYRPNFVTNKNPTDPQSVWHTGKLQGEVNLLNSVDQGVAYTRTKYAPNPLNQEEIIGLPGKDFSISGSYANKFSQHSDLAFLDNVFPSDQGYRQKVENTPNHSLRVSVFDRHNNEVAKYVRVAGFDHLLSTYEYDAENRLIKILSPLYHEKVKTSQRLTPWQWGNENLSLEEQQWQNALATRFIYDKNGHLIRKTTPDEGTTEYLNNSAGQMRFMVSLGFTQQPQKIVYFDYDYNNQLTATGHIDPPLPLETLRQLVDSDHLPSAKEYQNFNYADDHLDPQLRGRIKDCVTYNEGEIIAEKLHFDKQQQITERKAITSSGQFDQFNKIQKHYKNGKISRLTYPMSFEGQPLQLVYSYNRLGQLVGIGLDDSTPYVSFTYHATGQLATEQYLPNTSNSFTRSYQYNSPGFLEKISDPFLTEEITYTKNGYGQAGYGDGMIMEMSFNASWSVNADQRWFQVGENDLEGNHSTLCIKALKRAGYLTDNGTPIKLYVRDKETTLPLLCDGETGRNIAKLVAEKQIPSYYGHRFAYGNHQELIKAKYFTSETESLAKPLQADSFAKEIRSLTKQQSNEIWQLLTKAGYILPDQHRNDPVTAVGKRGKTIFRDRNLHTDLAKLNKNYTLYVQFIKKLIITSIGQREKISQTQFETSFLHWEGVTHTSSRLTYNWHLKRAKEIGKMLFNKKYLSIQSADLAHSLDGKFTTTLNRYSTFIPEIVRVLTKYFAHGLGETAFDLESYQIDANGNHRLFYTGFNRYELAYRNNTNQIQSIKLDWPGVEQIFEMKHDAHGNLIQALHKNIQHIQYHPVSQRTTFIQLTDGRSLWFYYDAQGERILKRVFDSNGNISHETYYLRDEQGRVLMDWQLKYSFGSTHRITTAYLYGPRGLLGFIRDNNFYSVFTDHAGSVRLITKNNQVVAAYDYLPYGQLMRSFGTDPEAQIVYRYTGQEWDEETGLYNYHARLYDPSIGRFYQIDPKSQYFSPYKYAGNSPISVIDPDGELAFTLICLISAIAGAYLGGAAANNRWNPADWDWKDSGNWIGIIGGGLAGGLLPVGFVGSVSFIGGAAGSTAIGIAGTVGFGASGAYLMAAAGDGNWDPSKWKWDRPGTWNSLFQGFGAGSGLVGGIGVAHSFAKSGKALTALGRFFGANRNVIKAMFLTISYGAGGGVAYGAGIMTNNGNAAFWQWDWENPGTWSALVDGFDSGMGLPQNFMEMGRGIGKIFRNPKQLANLVKHQSKRQSLLAILKNPKHPFYKTVGGIVMTYYMGSAANKEFDITKWKNSYSTYEGVLNGVFFGKDFSNMLKLALSGENTMKNTIKKITNKFKDILHGIKSFRKKKLNQMSNKLVQSEHLRIKQSGDSQSILIRDADGPDKLHTKKNNQLESGKYLTEEGSQKIKGTSDELAKWQMEAEELAKKKREIYPDEEPEFLNCHRAARRRRRDIGPCTIHNPKDTDTSGLSIVNDKFDFGKLLFKTEISYKENGWVRIEPSKNVIVTQTGEISFNPKQPQNFAEYFSPTLQTTPNNLASSKPGFWSSTILSLAMMSGVEGNAKRTTVNIELSKRSIADPSTYTPESFRFEIVKLSSVDSNGILSLNTFIIEGIPKNKKKDYQIEDIKEKIYQASKYSKGELDKIVTESGRNTKIQENVQYISSENSFFLQELSTDTDSYVYRTARNELDSTNSDFIKLNKISPEMNSEIDNSLREISDKDLSKLDHKDVEGLVELLWGNYKDCAENFKFRENIEANIHGSFYGALLGFKQKYNLDICVERIAGKGYADMMLLFRGQDGNKSWKSTPIIVEFKADKTSSSDGIQQIKDRGYFYNLSLKTVAEKAIIVGINSDTRSEPFYTSNVKIPKYEGLINVLQNPDKTKWKIGIENSLKHLDHSFSNLANKGENNNYLSRLLIGEFLAKKKSDENVYIKTNNGLTSIIFKQNGKWVMLNVDKSGKPIGTVSKGSGIIGDITQIDVTYTSKAGFSAKFLTEISKPNIILSEYAKIPETFTVNRNDFFTNSGKFLEDVANSLKPIKDLIKSESDFQAVLQGILLNHAIDKTIDKTIIRVFPEVNPSKEGRIDLVVQKLQNKNGVITENGLVIMELKYAKNSRDVNKLLNEANEQVARYSSNLEPLTDLNKITTIAAVFDQTTCNIKQNVLENVEIADNPIKQLEKDFGEIEISDKSSRANKRTREPDSDVEVNENPLKKVARKIRSGRSLDNKKFFEDRLESDITNTSSLLESSIIFLPPFKLEEAYKYRSIDTDSAIINRYSDATVSSGSAKVEFWPVRVLKGVTAMMAHAIEYLYPIESAGLSSDNPMIFGQNDHDNKHDSDRHSNLDSVKSNDHVKNEHKGVVECVPYIWDGETQEYVTEYVASCSLSHGNIKVFSNIHQGESSVQNKDYHLSGDSYKNCRPIEFQGRPSVYCEGEKSNMVYTENVQLPIPSLDAINAQLMLARAFGIDKLIGELTTKFKLLLGLGQAPTNEDQEQGQVGSDPNKDWLVQITAQQRGKWEDNIEHIENLIETLSVQALRENNRQNLNWVEEARFILQDHKKDVDNLSKQKSLVLVKDIEELDKKLEYLQMDLEESMDLPTDNILNDRKEFMQKDNQYQQFNSMPSFEHLVHSISADNSLQNIASTSTLEIQ
jgi:RHS repeat-associated protein